MKKVEFQKDSDAKVTVYVDDEVYGSLEFGDEASGDQKGIWIFWPMDTDDGVSYFDSLKGTEEAIKEDILDWEE